MTPLRRSSARVAPSSESPVAKSEDGSGSPGFNGNESDTEESDFEFGRRKTRSRAAKSIHQPPKNRKGLANIKEEHVKITTKGRVYTPQTMQRIRNREASMRSRMKKKMRIDELEVRYLFMTLETLSLKFRFLQ
jgi:Basic region leucine zipper